MKIAVTGGSGRIGRAVVEMACAEGHQVVSIDRVSSPPISNQPGVTFAALDVTNYPDFERALRGSDALVHLAAIPSPFRDPDHEVHNNNVVGSYNALRAAAEVLRGRRVASGVRLMVAPASLKDQAAAQQEGVLQALLDAGAELFPTACGACAGYGDSVGDNSTVISSTARNFKGRMGSATAQVYLGSPYTVAASALRGFITDPREVLA